MNTFTKHSFTISISLLFGLGLQFLFTGIMFYSTLNFSNFSLTQWILQSLYLIVLITLPLNIKD